jgi:TPR repeat protein
MDEKKAFEYWQLSAVQGHAFAQFNLGLCYENGRGVAKDIKKAVEYWQLSAAQGDDDAKQALARLGVADLSL